MAFQYSVTVRNNQLDQVEVTTAATARLRLFTGAQPADCATASSGTLLCDMILPSDWMNAAAAGAKTKLGTWVGTAVAAGTIGYWRIFNNAGTICHVQGNATPTGGGGDMEFDNLLLALNQSVVVNTFTLNAQNA